MSRKKQNVYLEMVQWLETHDGIKPRFQIVTLRRYEQMRKEKAVEKRMRRSVAKQVQNNASTRSELLKVVRQSEEHISELSNN